MSDTTAASAPPSAPAAGPEPTPAVADALRDRRSVLRCAAIAALAGASAPILAACGGGGDSAGGGGTSAPATTPTGSAPSSSAPATGSGGAVLGPVSDVPVGGGKVFSEAKVVVTQPTAGEYKGFSAVCTHAGNPVGSVEGGQIICPFHNSHFSITDGSPVSGPAEKPLPAVNVAVEGTNIVQSA